MNMKHNSISDSSLIAIAANCPHLQELNINCCHAISDLGIIEIASHCSGLQKLEIQGFETIKMAYITDAAII